MTASDLDAEVRRADPDRWLASRFIVDRGAREKVIALLALDHQLTRAEALAANPLAAEIRLTWWRDVIASGADPGHPLAAALRRHELGGPALAAMIEARIAAVGEVSLTLDDALRWARDVQGALAVMAGRELGAAPEAEAPLAEAGTVWGLVVLRRASRVAQPEIDPAIRRLLGLATTSCTRLPPTVFPAALSATLARADRPGGVETRLRLGWAVLTGRL